MSGLYWLENIDKYIEHYASPAIQQRGKTLFNIGAVRDVEYDTENNSGTVDVSAGDIFTVKIYDGVNQDFRNIRTECTCDFDNGMCKHAVAGLHALKKKFQYNSAAIINIINQNNTAHSSSSEYSLNEKILSKYQLEAQYPARVRENSDLIVKYKNLREDLLSFKIGEPETNWSKNSYHYETVDFFLNGEKTTTRCSCDQKVLELCNHQMKALHHLFIELGLTDLLSNFPPIEQLKEEYAKEYGLTDVADVDKFFTLTLTTKGLEYIPKDKDMVSYSDHVFLLKKVTQIREINRYNAITPDEIQEDNLQGIAIFLDNQSDGIPLRMHIIEGKSNKKTQKIVSNVKSIDDPSLVHPELKSFYLEYEKLKSLYNTQFADHVHPKLLNFIIKHRETLSDVPLYLMKEKFSFRRADMRNVMFSPEPVKLLVRGRGNKMQNVIEGVLDFNGIEVPIANIVDEINPILLFHNNAFFPVESLQASKLLQLLIERPVMKYAARSTNSFIEQISRLSEVAAVDVSEAAVDVEEINIEPLEYIIELSENQDHLIIQPLIQYSDQKEYQPTIDPQGYQGESKLVKIVRDLDAEHKFIDDLSLFDPIFGNQKHLGYFYKHINNVVNTPWIFNFYDYCKSNNIQIRGYESLETINYNPNKATVNLNITSGIDWFEGDVTMQFGDQDVELAQLRKAILNRQNTVDLTDGTKGLLPEEWIEKLGAIFRNSELEDGKLLISKMKFNLVDSLFEEINDEQLKMEIDYRKRLLLDFDSIEPIPIPDTINAELRGYQKQGFYWMKFLDDFGFGGCLADDMGLGKTLQVLTFMAYKKSQDPSGTSLIVMPKSLLFNWEAEIHKFCPSIKYLIYHGNKRKVLLKDLEQYDLILSTYGTITNDVQHFMNVHFSYVILDESQAIKNPSSNRYKAMRLLKSDNKLVMTGTPIENQTFDLFAQFNFINPGFFGSSRNFQVNFSEPIDLYGNEAVSMELRKLVKPFLLRRTKEQVAKDLPPKTESIIHVEMGAKQRVIYETFLQRYKDYVSKKISENGIQKSKLFVIEALLKLRQICNSPAILNEDIEYPNESVKIDVLMDQLSSVTPRHKVLIISQFTSMLAKIRDKVEAAQLPYCYLDGSTKNRKQVVDDFNEKDEYRVFLLSLKAGGVGLNLAAAEYVYIVDPWWNPAAEAQAIDRAHRIGQENHVFAYRMICKDSIEEKIQMLQQRKKKMAADIIQVEESFVKSLTQDDIMALFS